MDRMSHWERVSSKMNESKKCMAHIWNSVGWQQIKKKNIIATITWEEKVSLGLIEIECYYHIGYVESAGAAVWLRGNLGILSTLS